MKKKSCWYIPGYGHPALLAIKVYKVEKSCHDTGKGGYAFWWMSEPIGHAVTDDDLMTKAEARKELDKRKREIGLYIGPEPTSTLRKWRVIQAKFIMSTWKNTDLPKMTVKEFLKQFPAEKETEWFN